MNNPFENKNELRILLGIVCTFAAIILCITIHAKIQMRIPESTDTVITVETTVTDKQIESRIICTGTWVTTYSYYLCITLENNETKQKVQVPAAYYKINKYDTVFIDVSLNKNNNVKNITLTERNN